MDNIKRVIVFQVFSRLANKMAAAVRIMPVALMASLVTVSPTMVLAHAYARGIAQATPIAPSRQVQHRLPELKAEALSGNQLVFPKDANQKNLIFIVCYERKCAENQKAWWQALESAIGNSVEIYAVVDAVRAPFFIRGMIKRNIVDSTADLTPKLRSHFLLNFKDKGWKSISPTTDDANAPAIVVVNADGSVSYTKRENYNEASFNQVMSAVRSNLQAFNGNADARITALRSS